jgi:GntR family transcriptional regulator
VKTAQSVDAYKLNAIVKSAQLIISDRTSFPTLEAAVQSAQEDIIRPPKLIRSDNFIGAKSINLLKRELGLG